MLENAAFSCVLFLAILISREGDIVTYSTVRDIGYALSYGLA